MNYFTQELYGLFDRDLERLKSEVESTDNADLWKSADGVTNCCGVLAQHIAGNLKHFIGAGLGKNGYVRNRKKEFTDTGVSKQVLIEEIESARGMIEEVLGALDESILDEPYPMEIPMDYSTYEFLLHLYGHLNYHLGQYNYLRRILAENEG